MRNMKWFRTKEEAKAFAKKVKGTVFRFGKREKEILGTDCEYYVRWEV